MLGLRYRDGKTEVVLPYLKEPELGRDAANLALRILELHMNKLLPGAIPVVLDLRRPHRCDCAATPTATTSTPCWPAKPPSTSLTGRPLRPDHDRPPGVRPASSRRAPRGVQVELPVDRNEGVCSSSSV
ncbi:hypothetical protein [Saccharopolyspora pogona]|uniref:hypothetical protein n=1 Tax=Saccharopolyspora pogona TaxID=333966 RepID=UPI001685F19E|nr:hypothetical protein [Saccharopolyspora pogona]